MKRRAVRGALLAAGLAGLVGCAGQSATNDAGAAGGAGPAGQSGSGGPAGSGGQAGRAGSAGGGGGAGGATSAPTGVLVFFGHSGVVPAGILGAYGKHDQLSMRYQAAGLTVMMSDVWPASLDAFRLVILPVPGLGDTADVLDTEVAALVAFLTRGGTLYVENEFTSFNGTAVINDLLTRLGATVRAQTATIAAAASGSVFLATGIGDDPLLAGITALGFNSSSGVVAGPGQATVTFDTDVVMAIEKRGAGRSVVAGDQQFIDDIGLTDYATRGGDNLILANHLAGLP